MPGVIVAYLTAYLFHGASNPIHMTLLHRQVDGTFRATVSSLNSMAGLSAGALGLIALTALAEATSLSIATYVGALVLAAAAPLYIPAWRAVAEKGTGPGLTGRHEPSLPRLHPNLQAADQDTQDPSWTLTGSPPATR